MTETAAPRVHELNLYRRYFDLVATGQKTIEVRVKYPHLEDLAAGDVIRFRIKARTRAVTSWSSGSRSTRRSRNCSTGRGLRTSTRPPPASSSSPTSARSTRRRRKRSARSPSRSSSCRGNPPCHPRPERAYGFPGALRSRPCLDRQAPTTRDLRTCRRSVPHRGTPLLTGTSMTSAEAVGFEPTVTSLPRRFSRPFP